MTDPMKEMLVYLPAHQRCPHCGAKPWRVSAYGQETPVTMVYSSGSQVGRTRSGLDATTDYTFQCEQGHETRVVCTWRQV